jgi:HK97 family phage major capsid protein
MKANFAELKKQHKELLDKADGFLSAAERGGRALTHEEDQLMGSAMRQAEAIGSQIASAERFNTLRISNSGEFSVEGRPMGFAPNELPDGTRAMPGFAMNNPALRSPEYARALHSFLTTGGKAHGEELTAGKDGNGGYYLPGSESYTRQRRANGSFVPRIGAATYEGVEGGSGAAGGYAVSVPTEPQIIPLALPDLGIYDAATVITTVKDIKIPLQTSFGTSVLKSESNSTIATFGGSDFSLGQVALNSYMAGALRLSSWELIQDVQAFQQFIVDDLIKGQRILEGSLLATGTGTGEAQGVFGNTGTGTGSAYELTGTASSDGLLLLQALFDVTATLKGQYQPGAAWIMSRATGLAIRRAQMQSNLYIPIATTDPDGTERILGKPVFYDVSAPSLPTATTAGVLPILYGDFKAGYIIGVRGGAGINVKILDQPWAAQGQLGVLAYRRLDGRVRLAEAIQSVKISHA